MSLTMIDFLAVGSMPLLSRVGCSEPLPYPFFVGAFIVKVRSHAQTFGRRQLADTQAHSHEIDIEVF